MRAISIILGAGAAAIAYAPSALAEPITTFASTFPVITSLLAGVAGTAIASAIMPKPPKPPEPPPAAPTVEAPPPVVTPPTPMPIPQPDSQAAVAATRKSIKEQLLRRGRASTILTEGTTQSDALGG